MNQQRMFNSKPYDIFSGLDPTTKRQIWEIIAQAKQSKCILLTTHSLEEADVLASKIAIMAKGQVRCLGDALHLKRKFGEGYRLSVNFDERDRIVITNFVQTTVPNASEISTFTGNATFALPKDLVVSQLLIQIEQNKSQLRLLDYAFSQTTLEDVFMNIVQQYED